jgi:dihydroorotase
MSRLRITGGRLLDPASGRDEPGDVCIEDGAIVALGAQSDDFAADETIDASRRLVCPGLIDLSARLGEPGSEHKASIASEARAAVASGITTVVMPPDTSPSIDAPSVVELIRRRASDADAARVLPLGAITRSLDGERLADMAGLHAAGCPGVSDAGHAIRDSLVLRRALEYAATFGIPALLSAVEPDLNHGCLHEGQVATRLGLPGIPAAAESAGLGRSLAIAAGLGTPVHVGHLSARASLSVLRQARATGARVTADAAVHQLFFTEQDAAGFDPNFHLKPPLRTTSDREALRRAVADGEIEVICSDHTPHDPDAKDGPFAQTEPGASGLDTLLPMILRLVEEGVTDRLTALATVTSAPATVLGLDSGRLTTGAPADICVIDPEAVGWCTPERLVSGAKNSPFLGWEVPGAVTETLVGGRLVHRRDGTH